MPGIKNLNLYIFFIFKQKKFKKKKKIKFKKKINFYKLIFK
jgi:hypothetical protein